MAPNSERCLRSCASFAPAVRAVAPVLGEITSNVANTARAETNAAKNSKSGAAGTATIEIRRQRVAPQRSAITQDVARKVTPQPSSPSGSENPQNVMEYAEDVHSLLLRTEAAHLPDASYMDRQTHITLEMRAILVDWLVDVHRKYRCKSSTLFLTVALLDRFLATQVIDRKRLQLLGVAAMLVAAKFEERNPPRVKDFVHITDNTYSADEIRDMEVVVLTALDFEVCQPTALDFLHGLVEANRSSDTEKHLAQYLLELTLLREMQLQHLPCMLAASAVSLAARLIRKGEANWSVNASVLAKAGDAELEPCTRGMLALLVDAETSGGMLRAARKKFSDGKFSGVAKTRWTSESSSTPQIVQATMPCPLTPPTVQPTMPMMLPTVPPQPPQARAKLSIGRSPVSRSE